MSDESESAAQPGEERRIPMNISPDNQVPQKAKPYNRRCGGERDAATVAFGMENPTSQGRKDCHFGPTTRFGLFVRRGARAQRCATSDFLCNELVLRLFRTAWRSSTGAVLGVIHRDLSALDLLLSAR